MRLLTSGSVSRLSNIQKTPQATLCELRPHDLPKFAVERFRVFGIRANLAGEFPEALVLLRIVRRRLRPLRPRRICPRLRLHRMGASIAQAPNMVRQAAMG